MNYIKELNAFKDWILLCDMPTSGIVLWHTLMSLNNATFWKREFNAPNSVVRKLSGLSKQGLLDARDHLVKHGRIRYQKGKKGQAPVYEMVSFESVVDSFDAPLTEVPPRYDKDDGPVEQTPPLACDSGDAAAVEMDKTTSQMSRTNVDLPMAEVVSFSREDLYLDSSADSLKDEKADSCHASNRASSSDPFKTHLRTETMPIHKHKQKRKRKQDSSRLRASDGPISLYEANIGKLSPMTADLLAAWTIERGEPLVRAAIELTIKRGGRTFRYVEVILKEWAKADIMTVEDMRAYEWGKYCQRPNVTSFAAQPGKDKSAFFNALREGAQS